MEGGIRAWCAGALACIVVPPMLHPLKESAASSGTVPKDPLDTGEGGGLQSVLVEDLIGSPLDDPLGGCVSDILILAKKVAKQLDRPGSATGSAALPICQGYLDLSEELCPKRNHAPGANNLRVPSPPMKHQKV